MTTDAKRAVAEFARGLLAYVDDGSVIEVRPVGFVTELQAAIAADPGAWEDEEGVAPDPNRYLVKVSVGPEGGAPSTRSFSLLAPGQLNADAMADHLIVHATDTFQNAGEIEGYEDDDDEDDEADVPVE